MRSVVSVVKFLPLMSLVKDVCARAVMETEQNRQLYFSSLDQSLSVQTLVCVVGASAVVFTVGLMLYCITCIHGPPKREKRVRHYTNKPPMMIARPVSARNNSSNVVNQQHYAHRVVRPGDHQPQAVNFEEYETHSLTMYIPPED